MPAPNPAAVGAVIEVFESGELTNPSARPYFVEKAHADGTVVQVGLGELSTCDVRITFPGGKVVSAPGVRANQRVNIHRDTGIELSPLAEPKR